MRALGFCPLSSPTDTGRTAPLAAITSSVEDVVSDGEVFFVYDDDKFDVTSVSIQVLIGSSSIFSTNLAAGTFDFSFNNNIANQIQNNPTTFDVIVCVEDGDGESDCDNLNGKKKSADGRSTRKACGLAFSARRSEDNRGCG